MNSKSIRRAMTLAALTLPLLHLPAQAQDSAPPIEYVIGFPPGSSADAVGRMVADLMAKALNRNVVVNNKPGAGTTIAAQYVATAKVPMLFNADFATLATMPHLMSKLPYDPEKDFAPISLLARVPLLLAVSANVPARNLQEFRTWAATQRDGVPYGSSGPGTPHHLAGELIKDLIGVKMVHVAYKGGAPMTNDLLAGQIPAGMMDVANAKPQLPGGKIRGLAIATLQRSPAAPDVPTFHEQGYPNFEASAWQAVVASLATPPELRVRFTSAVHAALNAAPLKARLDAIGVEGLPSTPEQLASFARAENIRWGEIIRKHNIKIE